jgi:hypothetical protein
VAVERQEVDGEAGQAVAGEVVVADGLDTEALAAGLQTQALELGQLGCDAAQEHVSRDAVAGREPLGDREGQLVDGALLVASTAIGLEERRVEAPARLPEQHGRLFVGQAQVEVPDDASEAAAIFDRVQLGLGPRREVVGDELASAAVVGAAIDERLEDAVGAGRRQPAQRRGDQAALLRPLARREALGVLEQVEDDERAVVVVDRDGQAVRVHAAIAGEHVLVKEADRDGLALGVAVELVLAAARQRGADEGDEVAALERFDRLACRHGCSKAPVGAMRYDGEDRT